MILKYCSKWTKADSSVWKIDFIHMLTFLINLFIIQPTFIEHLLLLSCTLDALDSKRWIGGWLFGCSRQSPWCLENVLHSFVVMVIVAPHRLSRHPSSCWMFCPLHRLSSSPLLVPLVYSMCSYLWAFQQVFSYLKPSYQRTQLIFQTCLGQFIKGSFPWSHNQTSSGAVVVLRRPYWYHN